MGESAAARTPTCARDPETLRPLGVVACPQCCSRMLARGARGAFEVRLREPQSGSALYATPIVCRECDFCFLAYEGTEGEL